MDINPLSRYGETDWRVNRENPNPIFNINYDAPIDREDGYGKGEYIGVNSDFMFNFDRREFWTHSKEEYDQLIQQ